MSESSSQPPAGKPTPEAEARDRLGILPNFFRLAPEAADVTENLWGFAKFGYVDNPLPPQFKERLFVYLSRFCEVRYCIARHVGFLIGLGRPAGDRDCPTQTVDQVVSLIRRPLPRGSDLEAEIARLEAIETPILLPPEAETPGEVAIFACATHVFLQTPQADKCLEALRKTFDGAIFQHLLVFLTFVRTAHFWTKVHPELKLEDDITQLLAVQEALAECIQNDHEAAACETTQVMLSELTVLRREREQAELLRTTLASIGDAVIATDLNGHVTILNPVAEGLTGWIADEAFGQPLDAVFRIVNEGTRQTVENPATRALREGSIVGLANHTILLSKDGTERPIEDSAAPIRDEKGRAVGCVLVFRDVSERRHAERSLAAANAEQHRQKAFLERLIDNSPVAIAVIQGPELQFSMVNRAFQSIASEHEDLVGQSFVNVFPEATALGAADGLRNVLQSGEPWKVRSFQTPIGERQETWWDGEVLPLPNENGVVDAVLALTWEITDRRRADENLQASEERYRSLTQAITSVVWTTDAEGRIVTPQESWARYTGQQWEQLRGFGWVNALHPDDRQRVEKVWRESTAARTPYRCDYRLWHAESQTYRHIEARGVPVLNAQGSVREWVGKCLDVEDRWQAQEKLRYQSALTRTITDNATTAIFLTDLESRCTFMNPAAEALTGFTFAEADGRVLHELIHHTRPDGSPYSIADCPLGRALPEKFEVHGYEDTFIRRTGEYFPVLCNARPIYQQEEPVGTVIEALDLTQQQAAAARLRESEDRFRQLGDAISQLAWMANPDGHIDWYNNRWYEYTGTTFEQMEGWGWQMVHHPDVISEVLESWRSALASGEPFDMVFPLRGADGEYRPFLTRALPFRDDEGRIIRWFGTNTDISELNRIQEELRKVAAQLSDADRRKDEFLATLAHELRNPLAPIRTGLEVMKLAKDDPVLIEEIRETMERQTQQLITLVDDLLDVSRITRGKLELRTCRVNLADVMRSAVEASQPYIKEAGHQLTVTLADDPIYLEADPHRLAQVLSNLLNNAAKYTPEGGNLFLSVERQQGEAVVSVGDTGIGIPEQMLDRVFEMFAQVERPMERGYTGLGIGLTLVKSLVEMHGGRVDVRSDGEGQGSEFSVHLPVDPELPATESAPRQAEAPAARRRVLVVDDNEAAARMLAMVVKMLGSDVCTAGDGEQGIQLAAEFRPDIILMDIGMPKLNGFEAARHIRQQPWGQKMILVALTGWGQDEDKQRTKQAGFDYHMTKPAEPAELQKLLALPQQQ